MYRPRCSELPVLTLLGSLCCLGGGCGPSAADEEYRSYAETAAAAGQHVEPAVINAVAGSPADAGSLRENPATDDPGPPVSTRSDRGPEAEAALARADLDSTGLDARDVASGERPAAGDEVGLLTPRRIQLLVPENEFPTVGPEGAVRISYDDIDLLKVLNMDEVPETVVNYLPDWLQDLDGRRVRIRGFMMPTLFETGLAGFVLARDNQLCCYGRNPTAYDVVPVQLRDNVTTDFIDRRPFDVAGVFHIQVSVFAGRVEYVYYIDDAIVIEQ
jgi:hypothetical protein